MKSDQQLQKDVLAELVWEPSVYAARIGVAVKEGVVTLSGEVGTFGEKWNAERAAQRVSGVRALAIEIKVTLAGSTEHTDSDVAESVEDALDWTTGLPLDSVKVMVEDGWVTLSGEVAWQYQRQAAVDAVRYVAGVTGVSDQIAIEPAISMSAVKSDIEAALKRRATAESRQISVQIDGAEVTLTGAVDSWAERELATHSAWGTPGVRNVIDKMTLAE